MRIRLRTGICVLLMLCIWIAAPLRAYTAEEREGGLVGTGVIGVLGVVTGLGSIHVNGMRITYDPALHVETAFGSASPDTIVPGHTVQIEARQRDGTWVARSIQRHQPLIAPVEAISRGRIRVLGTTVEIAEGIAIIGTIRRGTWIDVSGLWRGDTLVASRIEMVPPQRMIALRGTLTGSSTTGWYVGGVRVAGIRSSHLKAGQAVAVRGRAMRARDGGTFVRAQDYALRDFSEDTDRAVVEGYLSTPSLYGTYTVFGSGATALAADRGMAMPDWRGLHCIDLNAGGADVIRTPVRVLDDDSPAALARRDWRSGTREVCD